MSRTADRMAICADTDSLFGTGIVAVAVVVDGNLEMVFVDSLSATVGCTVMMIVNVAAGMGGHVLAFDCCSCAWRRH